MRRGFWEKQITEKVTPFVNDSYKTNDTLLSFTF